jgi:hypothetical protein
MAKFIMSPGKALGEAALPVKAVYLILVVLAILNLADAFSGGNLIGFYNNFNGIWAWAVAGLGSYLLYDLGNTITRRRMIAKDIGYAFSVILVGLSIWNIAVGNLLAITPLVLTIIMIVFISHPKTKEYLAQKPSSN